MINLMAQARQDHEIDQRARGDPNMQQVREPHRYLRRYSGRILRARGNRAFPPEPNDLTRQRGTISALHFTWRQQIKM